MTYIEFGGMRIEANKEGYVANPATWTKELAEYMAQKDGLTLTDDHWEIIIYLREYFNKYKIAPMIKILVREIGKNKGIEKGNTHYLYALFPKGPAKQACRYAGLPEPVGCV